MNYTDEQLKRALAKMLPELVAVCNSQLCWIADDVEIIDTAILHLCWLVEETLDDEQQLNYVRCLDEDVIRQFWGKYGTHWLLTHASWQQRTIALAKVKGVEIV